MHDALNPLIAALDAAAAPVPFFLRDDDAGWDDGRLFALLDRTLHAGVPIDLAAIPAVTHDALATALCAHMRAAPGLLGVHQHGLAHTNHETLARKCEFGDARSRQAQHDDLRQGRERLLDFFGHQLDPIFTPPWNRCSADTPEVLVELGFLALSRSRGAPPQHALFELPVDVDWCKQRRLGAEEDDGGLRRIGDELAKRVQAGGPVGLMLHHADMNARDLQLLDSLLEATCAHSSVTWRPMRTWLPAMAVPATQRSPSSTPSSTQ